RLAGANGGEHLVVLDLVHVAVLTAGLLCTDPGIAIPPFVLARDGAAKDVSRALGAEDIVLHLVGSVHPVAAVMIAANALGILVNDREVVPDVAVLGIGARLPAAHAPAADRRFVAHHPVHRVDTVDGLLDDVIAREPAIVIPVMQLVLHKFAARGPSRSGDGGIAVLR